MGDYDSGVQRPDAQSQSSQAQADKPDSRVKKLRNWIFGGPLDKDRLRALGLGAVISYGCELCMLQWPAFMCTADPKRLLRTKTALSMLAGEKSLIE